MPHFYEIEKLCQAPLEDVLLKIYPVSFFKWLYDCHLKLLAETHPAALPQPERVRPFAVDKVPRKAYLITLLLAVLRDPAMSHRFFEALPQTVRDVIAAATWEPRVNLEALEQKLGREIVTLNPEEQRFYYEPFLLPLEHGFLLIDRVAKDYWGYYSGTQKPKKKDYCLLLPDAIRKVFKTLVPPPEGYELRFLDHLPSTAGHHYSCTQKAIADLRLVAEYIAQGQLKYTKSERVAMPSLKQLRQMTGGPEFFDPTDDSDLALLRTRLLVGGMAFVGEKEREKLLAAADRAEPVRTLFEKVMANATFLHEELLDHLSNRQNRWCHYQTQSGKELAAFFGKLPANQWITWENIRCYHALREQLPSLFNHAAERLYGQVISEANSWSTSIYVSQANAFELVSEPLLKGCAFLLAAFGLAEIAYDPPRQTAYHRPTKRYLTPYDGLRFVRLTPLGEFVFGRRKSFEIDGEPPPRSTILLDEARLLATCRNADALTALALGQFFEPLTPGRFRMTPKSFLAGCASRKDLENRIKRFRRVVAAKPPAIWEEFFAQILARIAPLSLEPDYIVLKVNNEEEIRRLLTSDLALREMILKVEGLRIAVRQTDLKKLAKRLEQYGYLSPIPSLISNPNPLAKATD